jgi:hypothetical protein
MSHTKRIAAKKQRLEGNSLDHSRHGNKKEICFDMNGETPSPNRGFK